MNVQDWINRVGACEVPRPSKNLAHVLALFTPDERGVIHVKTLDIQKRTGLKRRSVSRNLRPLFDAHLIARVGQSALVLLDESGQIVMGQKRPIGTKLAHEDINGPMSQSDKSESSKKRVVKGATKPPRKQPSNPDCLPPTPPCSPLTGETKPQAYTHTRTHTREGVEPVGLVGSRSRPTGAWGREVTPKPERLEKSKKTAHKDRVRRWRKHSPVWEAEDLVKAYNEAKARAKVETEDMPLWFAQKVVGRFSAAEWVAALGSIRPSTKRPFSVVRLVIEGEYTASVSAVREAEDMVEERGGGEDVDAVEEHLKKARKDYQIVRAYKAQEQASKRARKGGSMLRQLTMDIQGSGEEA